MPITVKELIIYDPFEAYYSSVENDHFKSEHFLDAVTSLSENIYNFVFYSDLPNRIKDLISEIYHLDQDKSKVLAVLIMEIIIGEIYLGDIINQISQKLSVDQETAKQIASIAVSQIFAPILPELKQMHIQKFGAQRSQSSPAPVVSPTPPAFHQNQQVSRTPPNLPISRSPNQSNVVDLRNKI